MFQCPSAGYPLFYEVSVENDDQIVDVSMPFRGLSPFLHTPSKCPYFSRLFEAVFADIYQNILTKTVFKGFSGLFIICSYFQLPLTIDYTPFICVCHLHFLNFSTRHSSDTPENAEGIRERESPVHLGRFYGSSPA